MKFKSDIEIQAGVEAGGSTGDSGQILSSTGTNGVAWIDQNAIGAATDFVFFNVKNETGSTILKGKGVMAVGTDGNSGHILIDEMVANGTVEPKYFLGVLEEDIPNGGFARVISFGQLDQFNTNGQNGETWNDGQILWCDPANPGDFTITEPDGPNVKIAAAFILNSSTNGKIQVRVQANEGIHDLHDTKITSQVDGDVLVWDDTTGVWFNDSTLNVDYTNGRVGIGTTIPNETLGLYKSDRPYIQLTSSSTGTSSADGSFIGFASSAGFLEIRNKENQDIRLSTNDTERMRITSGGKVGIGTTDPGNKLSVVTDPGSDDTIPALGSNGGKFSLLNNGGLYGLISGVLGSGNSFLQTQRVDGTATAYNMLLQPNGGNVGIGTTSPLNKTHIIGPTLTTGTETSYGLAVSDVGDQTKTLILGYDLVNDVGIIQAIDQQTAWKNLALGISGDTKVGVGEIAPTAKLHIKSPGNATLIRAYSAGYKAMDLWGATNGSQLTLHGGAEAATIVLDGRPGYNSYFTTGNVGIGTTSPGYKLDVSGTIRATGTVTAPTFSGALNGNATTATTLQTARNINNVSFNGSSNITIPTIFDTGYKTITNPGGGAYVTTASSVTGAIAITLPIWTYPMVRMTIQIYEYTTNESFTVSCGGHNSGTLWYNEFAYIVGNPGMDRRFTVRFGRTAGGLPVVYIGELASTWSYPQVFVTDVQVGYAGNSNSWTSGWTVGFRTGSFENVSRTVYNSQVGYAVSANIANTNVLRDGSGNFSAGTITAALNGNATTVSDGMYLSGAQTVTGIKYFLSNRNTTSDSPPLQVYSTSSGAIMSFHRSGAYAVNMGLDSDNIFRIGGWSAPANLLQLDMAGNLTTSSSLRAPIFYDSNNTGYYTDPASTSNVNVHKAYSYQGNGNVGGTGLASWHPSGMYSGGTQWLYGNMYRNNSGTYGGGLAQYSIVYDTNNTAFYSDPASQSYMSTINFGGILNGNGHATIGRNHAYDTLELRGYGSEMMIGSQGTALHINYRTCNSGAASNTPTDWYWRAGSSSSYSNHYMGNIHAATSSRAPIFYDSNNTGYYLDPASTSNVNVITAAGTMTATNFILSSDERKKTKIKDLSCNNIDISWKSFEMKNNEGEYRVGVIAQELEIKHPEFVNTDNEGFKSVKYIDLLIAKIAELEARLEKAGI